MNLNRKNNSSLGRTLCVALCLLATALHARAGERVQRRLAAMGTSLVLHVESATRPDALAQSELAVRAIETVEARLSTWRSESELSLANAAAPNKPHELSPELASDLRIAEALWKRTDAQFDPGLGLLVEAWGLRGEGRVPADGELAELVRDSGWRHFKLEGRSLTRTNARARLEEGAFGKGLGLDAALAAIDRESVEQIALELGGQWIVFSRNAEDSFPIGIAHCKERERSVLELQLQSGSVATSGNSERAIHIDGREIGHILDGRTGRPADSFGSLTVVARDGATADALATALYVAGPEEALRWASTQPDIEIVVQQITSGALRVRATEGLASLLTSRQPGLAIEFVSPPASSTTPPEGEE